MIGRFRLPLACLWACLLACDVLAADVSPALRSAAAQAPVEVFVLLRSPDAEAQGDYSAPSYSSFAARQRASFLAAMPAASIEMVHEYRSLPAFVLDVDQAGLDAIATHPDVVGVAAMQYGSGALADSIPQIGARAMHEHLYRGGGAVLGLLDSGVDANHPDIAGRVDLEECICARCCAGGNRASGPGSALSQSSHGPHVAGIMASAGVVAAEGVAPDAHLEVVRVINDSNRGGLGDWIAGLDLILASHPEVHAINMSLVSDMLYEPPCDNADVFTMAIAQLAHQLKLRGTLIVAAAGNTQSVGMLPAPACVKDVISVGAVTKGDVIASFSNVAPSLSLLAPGVAIVSDAPGGGTTTASGTSMASPHVTGSIGLLLPFVGRPFIAALPDVMRANGPVLTDQRTCVGVRCERFTRLQVDAAADWLDSIRSMRPGGGSRSLDCQVQWKIFGMPPDAGLRPPRIRCHDGDPSCDTDNVEGQCTFRVQACFNVPDRRLFTCDPLQTISAYRLVKPSISSPGDTLEARNALAALASLPPLPITESGQCSAQFDLVVPANMGRSIRFAAETLRGRDADRLRFGCMK